jgi:Redoxin.
MNYIVQFFGFSFFLFTFAIGQAQDSKAYEKEDVPLSHHLEARNAIDAWKEVEKASARFPRLTGETAGSWDPADPRTAHVQSQLVAVADRAEEFYTTYPRDVHALNAQERELDALLQALDETYATNQSGRIYARATALFKDRRVDNAKRHGMCNLIFMLALTKRGLLPTTNDIPRELQNDIHVLETAFPGAPDIGYFSVLAEDSKFEKQRPLLRELAAPLPIVGYRLLFEATLKQKEMIGKPWEFRFNAVDGRDVDAAKLKGNVIAVVFWGLTYPISTTNVMRLDNLQSKFHSQGLQAIGANVDRDSEPMKAFLRTNKIEWPQYWDGKELGNRVFENTAVTRAGTILLIDRRGLIRKYDGDEDLEAEAEALLKEQ